MKAERFQAIVEAYGADPARWPEAERDAALVYAEQAGEEARGGSRSDSFSSPIETQVSV